ncbi:solute carrier family 35 member E2A-like isoform X1 [Metopolophium dirhodum]|uniref:solute carrier family 35 member E2A-like isoform X1 n=1 Tax=Metopolophium dirhodum TaxID=44670 RepID=UPI00299047E8|nr:solute carrier family 35 member E2A-like isoform X1 [Metopolophium dirhodum]XP_060873539.1 solute carrier family 35 member E2A-like isoform X1 [Metopolophium dirhodum]
MTQLPKSVTVAEKRMEDGLHSFRAIAFLVLWYFFSGCTLFLNKYILSYLNGDPTVLGASQMIMTTICGFVQLYLPCGMYKQPTHRSKRPPNFYIHMCLVGCTRFITVLLGLISLNYVAVSFTETIKSSAPIFTVFISKLLLGEQTSILVSLSLVPIMVGLALCSSNEISFNLPGFIAALATNFTECLQNVYSKMLISGDKFKYTPAELQYYTSLASIIIQIPVSLVLVDIKYAVSNTSLYLLLMFILNGVFFHFQSITAYVLMDYISPVTYSVANTVKRAFLIWMSIILFGNSITLLSGLGTAIVIAGVVIYNKVKQYDIIRQSNIVSNKQYLLHITYYELTIRLLPSFFFLLLLRVRDIRMRCLHLTNVQHSKKLFCAG